MADEFVQIRFLRDVTLAVPLPGTFSQGEVCRVTPKQAEYALGTKTAELYEAPAPPAPAPEAPPEPEFHPCDESVAHKKRGRRGRHRGRF